MVYERDDFFEDEDGGKGETKDVAVEKAKEALIEFFLRNNKKVYYIMQLEVLFESKPWKFFHWVTYNAINELLGENFLDFEEVKLQEKTTAKFVFNKKFRDHKMPIRRSLEVIKAYANPVIAQACGLQAEVLFFNALAGKSFLSHGKNTNEYNGKKWTETDHNLDFIIGRDEKVYGCEVKNKWNYIDKDELLVKLAICRYLGVKPLFILRNSPKNYNWEVVKNGGYVMIFEAQIYPYGHVGLVKDIKEVLGLPADCPREIPSGIIDRFLRRHNKKGKVWGFA
jgi:hypothetical protein